MIGFSTGPAILPVVSLSNHLGLHTIEISTLREDELDAYLKHKQEIESFCYRFSHVSFHAPSKTSNEKLLTEKLNKVPHNIIVHPDIINNYELWADLDISIENMDRRKPFGQTPDDIFFLLEKLPNARFCFDVGHANQLNLLKEFLPLKDKMSQVHMSYVCPESKHHRLTYEHIELFHFCFYLGVPIILETPIESEDDMKKQLEDIQYIRERYDL